MLKIGDRAPEFTLPAAQGRERSQFALSEYLGKKHVVIAFYPLDWTPV